MRCWMSPELLFDIRTFYREVVHELTLASPK
jgi:hypothetical protein